MKMSYWRFVAMVATSTIIMYGLMYLNTYAFDHVFWSETRAWMALVMGAVMAVVMLSFMLNMYQKKKDKHRHLCRQCCAFHCCIMDRP